MKRYRVLKFQLLLFFTCVGAANLFPQGSSVSATIWTDAQSLTVDGRAWNNTESFYDRLPAKAKQMVREPVWRLSHNSAGISVRFVTTAKEFFIRWKLISSNLAMPHMPSTGVSGVDVYLKEKNNKWHFLGNGRPGGNPYSIAVFKASDTSGNKSEYCVYLPLYNGVSSVEIGVSGRGVLVEKTASKNTDQKPIVFYGTSITQGGCASRPGLVHTSIISRNMNYPVINLGFSGNGQMEPELAELISEIDASVYVIDCMRNMTVEQVKQRVDPFIRRLHAVHPNIPVLIVEESDFRNSFPSERGALLKESIIRLNNEGIKNLYYLPGDNLLGDDFEGTVDGIHPNDIGFIRQAEVFQKALQEIINKNQ